MVGNIIIKEDNDFIINEKEEWDKRLIIEEMVEKLPYPHKDFFKLILEGFTIEDASRKLNLTKKQGINL